MWKSVKLIGMTKGKSKRRVLCEASENEYAFTNKKRSEGTV